MATLKVRLTTRDVFLARLKAVSAVRGQREQLVPGPYGSQPGWVTYEAEQMLALVNDFRNEAGLAPVTLERVLHIEQSASGHVDYAEKYALRCAFLALGEED